MDYKKKYKKYKRRFISLKREVNKRKNAIFMLCMLKEHYVLGACIAAHCHRHYLDKLNYHVDLVVICDNFIYKNYESTLSKYFDKVINVGLRTIQLSNRYLFAKGKYTWIQHSLTKWECLKYEEYYKILFLDVDILPNHISFYKLFNFNTPAFHNLHIKKKCINSKPFNYEAQESYEKYIFKYFEKYGSMDGGICLLKPNMNTYHDYVEYTNKIYNDGLYSHHLSSPDETSLFYFFAKKKEPMYDICTDYAVIPWDDVDLNEVARGYNFRSYIKPWIKPKFLSWPEEVVWRDLYDKMDKKGNIEIIFRNALVNEFDNYMNLPYKKQKRLYSNKFVKKDKNLLNKINRSNNKFNEIMKIDGKVIYRDYGTMNWKKNTFDNIHLLKN